MVCKKNPFRIAGSARCVLNVCDIMLIVQTSLVLFSGREISLADSAKNYIPIEVGGDSAFRAPLASVQKTLSGGKKNCSG